MVCNISLSNRAMQQKLVVRRVGGRHVCVCVCLGGGWGGGRGVVAPTLEEHSPAEEERCSIAPPS